MSSILYKMRYHPNEEADLYISEFSLYNNEHGLLDRLTRTGLFKTINVMPDGLLIRCGKDVKVDSADEILLSALDAMTENCFESLRLSVEEYNNFFIFATHFPIGIVLAYKCIPYFCFEDSYGSHTSLDYYINSIKSSLPFNYRALRFTGARGESDFIAKKYVAFAAQPKDFSDPKAENYDITAMIDSITPSEKEVLTYVFDIGEPIELEGKSALILTSHSTNSGFTTLHEQERLYANTFDYFCADHRIIIKPHPNDQQGMYHKWFPDSLVLKKLPPAELLPLQLNCRIDRTLFLFSRATLSKSFYDEKDVVSFVTHDGRFIYMFASMHRYFVAANLFAHVNKTHSLFVIGADLGQLGMFLKFYTDTEEKDCVEIPEISEISDIPASPTFIVIDQIKRANPDFTQADILRLMKNASNDDVLVFINSKNDYLFYSPMDTAPIEYICPVTIGFSSIEDRKTCRSEELIYVYTKNDAIRSTMLKTRIDKALKATGVQITVDMDKINIREAYLAGMLDATEQRCLALSIENKQHKR